MIRMRGISFVYPGSAGKSLDQVDLTVRAGECVVVTGMSGCGKTTLTRVMNGLCPKFYGGRLEGEYYLDGKNMRSASLDEIGAILGSVFQDPRSQFFARRVRDEIVLAMENHCIPRAVMRSRLLDVSGMLGIEDLHEREMRFLSSGEKQKIAIASVCALQPKGMVFDEPSSNLDTNAVLQLSAFLSRLKSQGHTLVISEHRLYYLRDFFDRLIVMEGGRVRAEYTREEALRLTEQEMIGMGLRLFEMPEILSGDRIRDPDAGIVRAHDVSLRVDDTQILTNISLSVHKGIITAITGSNGAGKTSLCRIMTGLQKESGGAVYVQEKLSRRKRRIQSSFFVQQDVDYQLYTPTVKKEIQLGLLEKQQISRIFDVARFLGLDDLLGRHPNTLSGGQKQRVLLAAAVLRSVPLIVLDEPTSGLDGFHMRVAAQILRDLAADGPAILIVTHDVEFINRTAHRLIYMNGRKIVYQKSLAPG